MTEVEKLAIQVARQIEDRIIALGWPVGESLGSETTLVEQHGVSRGVLRQAIRLLEHKQVAKMRTGPGGGLVVSAPASSAIADTVLNYFTFSSVSAAEVFTARRHIESMCLRIAADRMSERGIERLRVAAHAPHTHELHRAITGLTRNPALSIVVSALLLASPVEDWGQPKDELAVKRHTRMVDMLLRGDLAEADRLLQAEIDLQESRSPSDGSLAAIQAREQRKLPERIAYQIYLDFDLSRQEPGVVVGSEQDLIDRYQISRSVFRQTAGILEYYDIIQMRPGRYGGMTIGEGSADHVLDAVVTYLDFMRIDPVHLAESRRVLELTALTLAMERLDTEGGERLQNELAAEASIEPADVYRVGPNLHVLIAALSGNRPIEFFVRVLARLQTGRIGGTPRTDEYRRAIGAGISTAHSRLVDAMLDGDVGLARHRLDRHLEAMTPNIAPQRVLKPTTETEDHDCADH